VRVSIEVELSEAAQGTGIKLLVLFGSRVRKQAHPHSDWDLGYLGDKDANIELLADRVAHLLGNDESDLVNLSRGSALLRFRVAAEGKALFEREPGLFRQFQDEVSRFWCDVEPVLGRAYASILDQARSA
jgi:predicted nucleotidyltransferase